MANLAPPALAFDRFVLDAGDERVVGPNGPVHLGRKAFRVLGILVDNPGRLVTKDELFEKAWNGAIVSESSLTSVIKELRRALGDDPHQPRFIESVYGRGYRFVAPVVAVDPARLASLTKQPTASLSPSSPGPKTGSRMRRPRIARFGLLIVVVFFLVGAAIAVRWQGSQGPFEAPIEVEPFLSGKEADSATLAASIRDEMMDVLNRSQIATREGGTWDWFGLVRPARRALSARVSQQNDRVQVAIYLRDVDSGTTLWSERFVEEGDRADKLSLQAAAATARTIYTSRDLDLQEGLSLPPETVALYLEGNAALRSPQNFKEGVPRQIFERMVARAPDSAAAHGLLALSLAVEALLAAPKTKSPILTRSRTEAERAIAISPAAAGAAFDALYVGSRIASPRDYAEAERWLIRGLREAPGFAFVAMRECRHLLEVGRSREALRHCQRAMALHPFAEPIEWTYAHALTQLGRQSLATLAIDHTASHSPEHLNTRRMRLFLLMFGGNRAQASQMLSDRNARPPDLDDDTIAILARAIEAMNNPDSADGSVAAEISGGVRSGKLGTNFGVTALAALGRTNEAYALLESLPAADLVAGAGPGYLFQPETASLRKDKRFWPLAARLGLVRYWAGTRQWPDFCGVELPLANCKLEAAKVANS